MTPLSLPLLHTVAAATAATVDPAVLLPACVAFTAAMFWLWSPRPLSRRVRERVLRVTMSVLVFFAVLPSVVPYDHVLPGVHDDDTPAAEATHARHCHGDAASCADAPVAAGPGQLIFSDPLVLTPALLAVLIAIAVPALTGIAIRPPTRPPRAFFATI